MIPRSARPHYAGLKTAAAMAVSVALASAGLILPTAPAHALTGDLACTTKATVTFSPALRPATESSVSATGTLPTCASANGKFSQLKSATITGTEGTATATGFVLRCPALLTVTATATLAWQNGEKSRISFTLSTDPSQGVKLSGTVTSGPMEGDTLYAVPVVTLNTSCPMAGLNTLTAVTGALIFT
ncbi:hypothetical protein C9F11_45855 (plasmid) [Streptomyces sp. YIM 121038]|uniref:hypothetical protein n=1 Tax=Streptomyces sp. YIM 121038 TaxID=2136401 RepID=UPI0011101096|nr:hypothetical protein [Streptomyces sp. YIM 121038]QCX82727.1 hypothetical protein C9F11_45855 [Streptomyces sp. YIM 121038]